MKEISWKQFFAIICINLCKTPPTVKELAEIMGSSHQNVKQILLKLEKKGFVSISVDEQDKRTYLAESLLAPSILLQDYISFEEISDFEAKAIIGYKGQTASVIKYPTKFKAIWNYGDGDFVNFDGVISTVSYDE